MKAAVMHCPGQPFAVEDRPVPQPSADQVLARMEAGTAVAELMRGDVPARLVFEF